MTLAMVRFWRTVSVLAAFGGWTQAFGPCMSGCNVVRRVAELELQMASDENMAGSFFNPVPGDDGDNKEEKPASPENVPNTPQGFDFDQSVEELLRQRKAPPKASSPSTIGGVPTSEAKGFGTKPAAASPEKPYVGIGAPDRPVNDVNNPEYDDQGYTIHTDEETGEKKRVFEALVDYPCNFTMKIVGANEGSFVSDIVQVVAESCEVAPETIDYTTRAMGKWTSVTVEAPVENAEMLYVLYESIDRDPRVKFKF